MYHVYLLYSVFADKYYIGSTGDDLLQRLRRHNSKHAGFAVSREISLSFIQKISDRNRQLQNENEQQKLGISRNKIEDILGK